MAGRGKHDVVIAAVDGSPADLVVRPADWATDLTGEHAVFLAAAFPGEACYHVLVSRRARKMPGAMGSQ